MAGRNQQLLAQMGHLFGARLQQAEHSLDHGGRVNDDVLLEQSNDVGEERQRLDLGAHKVHKHLLVECGRIPVDLRWLESDRGHDEGHKVGHLLVDELLVDLIHQHDDDGQFLEHFEREHSFWNEIVLKELCVLFSININLQVRIQQYIR